MKRDWIAMFSQTGSEIARLAKHVGKFPETIITNNGDKTTWCKELQELDERTSRVKVVTSTQAKTANFLHSIGGSKNALVTLHGWLRIIPKEICEQYEIVNGHPGLINAHPELKGKDPQQKAYEGGYATIGSVVHKVTPIVDDGEILEWVTTFRDEFDTLDDTFTKLKHTSYSSWVRFFDKRFVDIA
tara:strand:+ start:691 stop:1251 length:561 start_codon:yes stop_codon:yes gene_type:complete